MAMRCEKYLLGFGVDGPILTLVCPKRACLNILSEERNDESCELDALPGHGGLV
jgi:hypothetical protein